LHKVFWQEKYKTSTGDVKVFENIDEIRLNNQLLRTYYAFIEENMEGIHVIDLTGKYFSDEMHRWGKSPFHFEEGYYKEFLRQLQMITNKEA